MPHEVLLVANLESDIRVAQLKVQVCLLLIMTTQLSPRDWLKETAELRSAINKVKILKDMKETEDNRL